jgi:hypothetical protein
VLSSRTGNRASATERRRRGASIRYAFPLVILTWIGLFANGCAAPAVWHAEVPSPDGSWIAIAETVQNGGFGTASIATTVSLKLTRSSNAPVMVLAFACMGPVPRPYTLDNVANAGGTINLQMKWLTPSHLDVTYSGHPELNFQAVKLWGADISLRNVASDTTAVPSPFGPSNPR